MMVKMNKITLFICTLIFSFQLHAQVDSTKQEVPELPGDEVEVIKDFEVRLAETQMLRIIPQTPIVKTVPLSYDYSVAIRKINLDYLPPVIKPVALPSPEKEEINHTLLEFGYGFPRLSEGFAASDYKWNEKTRVGLRFKHLASSHNDLLPSGFYRNNGQLFGSYRFRNDVKARAGLDLAFNKNEILTLNRDFRNDRHDNAYAITVGIGKDLESDAKIHYDANVKFGQFIVNDLTANSFSETNLEVKANGEYVMDLWRAGIRAEFWNVGANSGVQSGFNALSFHPYAVFAASNFKIDVGLSAVISETNRIYPQVSASYAIKGDLLVARAYAQSRFDKNNHQNTYAYNPFIDELASFGLERELQFGGGISGRAEKWSYGADVYYSLHRDIQTFSLDSLNSDFVYDAELIDANAINVRLNGSYSISNDISLNTSLLYRNLRDTLGGDVLGYYDVEWEIGSKIHLLKNKFSLNPKASFLLLNPLQTSESDASFIDLQLDVNYDINESVGLFIRGFNLLNSRNARWEGYDALGISALGGVRVIF